MIIDQLSVFSENRAGMLAEITGLLADADIDTYALTLADTGDFGIFRLIVDAPKKAVSVLKLGGFVASLTQVVAVKMANDAGSLAKIAKLFGDAEISVEYVYAFAARGGGSAFVVLRVEDMNGAETLLAENGFGERFEL